MLIECVAVYFLLFPLVSSATHVIISVVLLLSSCHHTPFVTSSRIKIRGVCFEAMHLLSYIGCGPNTGLVGMLSRPFTYRLVVLLAV